MMAAAMGLRTALSVQANRTAPGSSSPLGPRKALALQMQDADQGEQPARGVGIDLDLSLQPLPEQRGAFVVYAAPAHVQGLDLLRRRLADGLEVAVTDQEVVLDHAAEGREREHHPPMRRLVDQADIEDETVFLDGDRKSTRLNSSQR